MTGDWFKDGAIVVIGIGGTALFLYGIVRLVLG